MKLERAVPYTPAIRRGDTRVASIPVLVLGLSLAIGSVLAALHG